MRRKLTIAARDYALSAPFVIARGAKTVARQIEVTIEEDGAVGCGAAVPYRRYGETIESAVAVLTALQPRIEAGLDREALLSAAPPCAARASLDAALWDLEAQIAGKPVCALAGLPPPQPVTTALTLVIDVPEAMAAAAAARAFAPLLKMKLAGDRADDARIAAVLAAAPGARLILDANEGLDRHTLDHLLAALPRDRIALIEQPLPAAADSALSGLVTDIPLYADESFHGPDDLPRLLGRYQGVNVKLEKTGGLTGALNAVTAARQAGFCVMLGCMVGSSRALAPAFLLAPLADVVDLDGSLFLAEDDAGGILAKGALLSPPSLWGAPRGAPGGGSR